MTIQYAILGLLSWRPLTGYDIKKMFSDSTTLYWSGNNNQIYRTLVQLHKSGLVSREIQEQENLPDRKIYSITDEGNKVLRDWVLSDPQPPQLRHPFLIQLAWADQLTNTEMEDLLNRYQKELEVQLLMVKEQAERKTPAPDRSKRENILWSMISENWIRFYSNELEWLTDLRKNISA
jgi:DNA-binding PadR family transcriptional regulator